MHSSLTSSKAPARAWFFLLALVGLVLLAACGSNTSTGGAAAPNATSNTSAGSTPTTRRWQVWQWVRQWRNDPQRQKFRLSHSENACGRERDLADPSHEF